VTPTVLDRFAECLERRPDDVAVCLVEGGGQGRDFSYADLYRCARRAAAGLAGLGLERGDAVLVALPTCQELLGIYLGALASGVVPLILPEPHALRTPEVYAHQVDRLAAPAAARHLVVTGEAITALASAVVERAVVVDELFAAGEASLSLAADPAALAHLQATSGSTGSPKVAEVRHRNVSANVAAIGEAIAQRPGDKVVSWLPFYHDMGLICLSCVLFWQRPLVLTDPGNFVRHPIRYWLQLISDHRGTISPAPASAYQICARLARRRRFPGLDLSSWRVGFCGAEPVHRRTLDEFFTAFSPQGLSATTLLPVYGLAEATLAVTIPALGRPPVSDEIDLARLEREHLAVPVEPGCSRPHQMVALGPPLAGHRVRVVDESGRELAERQVGEIEVLGPSVVDGYCGDDEGSLLKRPDGYLRSGDLGYLAAGELHVTGRRKDIIILRGRNLLPSQIERVVEEALDSGIHQGVAAVGVENEELGTEELHLLLESRQVPPEGRAQLEQRVREALTEAFEVGGGYIHWLRKGTLPKTTSGKIRRSRCRELILGDADAARDAAAMAGTTG
jgi:acyl-CoA synthetase (AMP-forming)/AMP-acid ligase II